jgi:hypothetical protein
MYGLASQLLSAILCPVFLQAGLIMRFEVSSVCSLYCGTEVALHFENFGFCELYLKKQMPALILLA